MEALAYIGEEREERENILQYWHIIFRGFVVDCYFES